MKHTLAFVAGIVASLAAFLAPGIDSPAQPAESVRNLASFGTKGDGKTMNTKVTAALHTFPRLQSR
ncbi:MAG: hypothetical protein ABSF95_12460 [Verrucomicrobiota bacterium]|jgi:hypothetical protein